MKQPCRSPLAEGSDVHDLEALDDAACAAPRTDSLDAVLLAYLHDDERAEPATAKVELTLYIVDGSESCREARRQLDPILAGYLEEDIRLEVRNLTEVPLDPAEEKLLAVPTLVVRGRRELSMTGEIEPATLLDILATCGARRVSRQ